MSQLLQVEDAGLGVIEVLNILSIKKAKRVTFFLSFERHIL